MRLCCRTGLVIAFAVLTAGCGDYEARMRPVQQRLERFDEENKYLEDALDLLKLDDGKEVPVTDVFVRAPKGISRTPDKPPLSAGGPYRYLRARSDAPVVEMHAAVASTSVKDFRDTVNQALGVYFREGAEPRKVTRTPPEREPIAFEGWENPQTGYVLYFCQQGGTVLALGMLPDKAKGGNLVKSMELCLDSVAFGADAAKSRAAWNRLSSLRRH